jgi:hypothetical protein
VAAPKAVAAPKTAPGAPKAVVRSKGSPAPVAAVATPAPAPGKSSRDCSNEASEKDLRGDERKEFYRTCMGKR